MNKTTFGVILAVLAGSATVASAGISAAPLGTAAPPATVAGRAMTYNDDPDPRGEFAQVNDFLFSGSPDVSSSVTLDSRIVGSSWGTWSHGHAGSVYWTQGATSMTFSMNVPATAFVFYAEPNPFDTFDITATGTDASGAAISLTQAVTGDSGASGYSFWTDGGTIDTVAVSSSVDFAVGEIGYSTVPAPGSVALGLLGGLGLVTRRRR